MDADAQSKVGTRGGSEDSRGQLILFIAAGIALYAILKTLGPIIDFPLRRISSSLATVILNAISIPSTLGGTVISTANFTFDVNPDCSGSTSLRVMLLLGALWFGMYPNLTFARRLLCLALAAPIAVFFNAVRVTVLVCVGDARGEPIEGFPHELIGIMSFGFAMLAVYLMTLLVAKEPTVRQRSGPRLHLAFLVIGLLVCYAPLFWGAWRMAPTTPAGLAHVALIAIGLTLVIMAVWSDGEAARILPEWVPPVLFAGSLVLLPLGTLLDVITLSALSLLGVLLAVILHLRGWRAALACLPLLGVVLLGLPGAHYPLLRGLVGRFATGDSYLLTALVEVVLAAGLVGLYLYLVSRVDEAEGEPAHKAYPLVPRLTSLPMKVFILGGLVGSLFQTYFNSQAAAFDKVHRLDVPAVIGEWTSVDLEPTEEEIAAIGRDRIVMRDYTHPEHGTVRLLASATGADRSRAHPPEQCMIVVGWEVREEKVIAQPGPHGELPMTRILLERGEAELEMRYWIEDPEGELFANFRELRSIDIGRRLTGKRTDWHVYRFFAPPGSPVLDHFIADLVASGEGGQE